MNRATLLLTAVALVAMAACSNGKSTRNAPTAGTAPMGAPAQTTPNCNGQSPVWAIRGTKVYLLPDDQHYGRTKRGHYICLSQAHAEGMHPARHGFGHHHHRRGVFSS